MVSARIEELEIAPFFEVTPDLVCIAGKDGFFRKVNHAVVEKLGYTKEELFAAPISTFIHEMDRERTSEHRNKLLNGNPLINFQNRYISKSGKVIWLDWTSIYFPDREMVFAIAKDVTERKLVEEEIEAKYNKFKSLATHFKNRFEKDKKFLAVELHEELAQLAAVVKMNIDWINNNEALSTASAKMLEHASVVMKLLITSIRRISFSMSPNMLDDLGLSETLRWLCKEFSILNSIPCDFECDYEEDNLSHEIKLDFFRICQESLNNIMYHAEASNVLIQIQDNENHVFLSISDNGKGFEMDKERELTSFSAIRERANSINGQLTIKSDLGKGTTVCVSILK